jgi:hypothetical protein
MSQSILIDAAVAAGTTTYNVGVIPKNSQLLTVILRVAIASDQGTTATVSVGKQELQLILSAILTLKL